MLGRTFAIAIAVLLCSTACTRSGGKTTSTLRLFTGNGALSLVAPVGKQFCYGVAVTGAGITPSVAGTCGPVVGVSAGFVGTSNGGGELTLSVPRGTDRKIDLYMYFADAALTCPAWDGTFQANSTNYASTYLVGSNSGVSLQADDESVTILATYDATTTPSVLSQSTLPACGAPSLHGVLYTNGDIRNSTGSAFGSPDFSFATVMSFFKSNLANDNTELGGLGAASDLNFGTTLTIPPYIQYVTKAPDLATLYGTDHDGQLYTIDGMTGAAAEIAQANCPFTTSIGCKVPPWIQSLSAGRANKFYALDHGGNIYSVGPNGVPTAIGLTVSAAVTQVSYF